MTVKGKGGQPKWKPPVGDLQAMVDEISKGAGLHTTLEAHGVTPRTFQRYAASLPDNPEDDSEQHRFCRALVRAEAAMYAQVERNMFEAEEWKNPAMMQRLLRRRGEYHPPRQSGKVTMQDNDGRKVTAEWGDLDSMSDEELARAYQAATSD